MACCMNSMTKQFNFVYQNIRSMRRNNDKLFAYLDSVTEKPVIIGLSEIWIYDNEINDYSVDGYKLFVNGNGTSRSGGVAIYASNNLNCKQMDLSFGFQTFDAISLSCSLGSYLMCVVCIYRLGYTSLSSFIDEFSVLLDTLLHTNLIIMGDFNLDWLQKNQILDRFLVLLSAKGLDSLVSEPTRMTDSSATCIDNALCRIDQRHFEVVSCVVLNLNITDHCLIEINFSCKTSLRTTNSRRTVVSHINNRKLKDFLLYEEWGEVYKCSEASVAFDLFLNIFCGHINSSTTFKSFGKKAIKLKPWMNNHLLNLLTNRNKFCRLAKRHPNNIRLRQYSLKLCESVNQLINSTKKQYYSQQFQTNGRDARKNWQTVNEILSGLPETSVIKEIIDQMGSSITAPIEMANEFNKHFTSVGASRCSAVSMPPTEKNRVIHDNYDSLNSFYHFPVTSYELYNIIGSLKNRTSPGIDGITNSIVRKMACFLVDVLSYIFNLSVDQGVFPLSLKRAVVIPIYKKNDKTCLNNYRPISLLSVFSKIFEKAMKSRIVNYLNSNNILSNLQFGFRQNRNTEMALLTFLDEVTGNIDRGLKVSALFVDMTKAFDRVEHSILLKILYTYGFRGKIHEWFCSYLNLRSQCVKVDGQLSNQLNINVGVPQGSVLGPLLFLVYINGIFSQDFHGSITAFADDLSFTYAGHDVLDNIRRVEHDLNLLSIWLSAHNMCLSDKTKLLNFREREQSDLTLMYHEYGCKKGLLCDPNVCFKIEQVKEFRYLGILIDDHLTWKAHIEGLKSRLLLVARKVYILRVFCPNYLLRMVYFALVNSLLQYGLSCWGGAYKTTLTPLSVRQKHIVRLICFKDMRSPSWPIFQKLDLLPLQHLFVFKVLRLFYTISGNVFVNYPEYNLRSNFQFKKSVPSWNLDIRRGFFSIISPIIFNNLPTVIRMCGTLSAFSKSLINWLKQTQDIQPLYSIRV